jgi:putative ABC transport system ATP-binding protein
MTMLIPSTSADQAGAPIIAGRGIVKAFGQGSARVNVLHEIDIDIFAGQMTFLIGESGSGKTTLISILSAILTADDGAVRVLDQDISRSPVARLARFRREGVGFVFQQFNLLPVLTAVENASVPLLAAGLPRRLAEARALILMDRLGIRDQANKRPNQLSGGQQQRVAIARALVHEPRIIICDEPTASLDAQSGRAVMELLRDIAVQPDRAVIVVTHDARTYRYADRIIRLEDGRITSDGREAPREID